jgi:hypothetical protein
MFQPLSISARPAALSRAVAVAWREAAGRGADPARSSRLAQEVYIAAGGEAARADEDVAQIIAAYSQEEGEWLWGPALREAERQREACQALPVSPVRYEQYRD